MIYICIPTTPERRSRTEGLVKSIQENTSIPCVVCVYENNDGGWVPAVYNMLENIDGIVWLLGSDTIVEKGAVETLYNRFIETFPEQDGVCEPFNEMHEDRLSQHPFAHTRTIRKYLDKRFVHWYSDNWFTIQAKRDNKFLYVPEAKIQHNHFTNGKAEIDETYKTIFNEETVAKDKLLFNQLTNE
jgi:GT2 family glycosyltransferase